MTSGTKSKQVDLTRERQPSGRAAPDRVRWNPVDRSPLQMTPGRRLLLSLPAIILYGIFFLIPLIILFRYSVASSESLRVSFIWTLDNYIRTFQSPIYSSLFVRSFLVAGAVAMLCALIGFPAAWCLARASRKWRTTLLVLLVIPWWASYIVRVFAWHTLFGSSGLINKTLINSGLVDAPLQFFTFALPAVVITEINLFLPLMIMPIYMSLERLDWNLVLAARSLGAGPVGTFRRVVLPLSLPGTIAGVIFVFMPVAGTFVVPELVGGTSGMMIGKVIASQFGAASNWAFGAALAMSLLVALLVCLALLSLVRRRYGGEIH